MLGVLLKSALGALAGAMLACTSATADAQVVSNDPAARAGVVPPMLVLPAYNDNAAILMLSCGGVALMAAGLPAAAGGIDLIWRVDDQPEHSTVVSVAPLLAIVERGAGALLLAQLRHGRSLTMSVTGPGGQLELKFDLVNETERSFALAVQAAGMGKAGADEFAVRIALNHLRVALEQADREKTTALTSLFEKVGIPLRLRDRRRNTMEILPDILAFLDANRGKQQAEELGSLAFGDIGWKLLRPLVDDRPVYRGLSGRMDDQLNWLDASCKKAG